MKKNKAVIARAIEEARCLVKYTRCTVKIIYFNCFQNDV